MKAVADEVADFLATSNSWGNPPPFDECCRWFAVLLPDGSFSKRTDVQTHRVNKVLLEIVI